MSTNYTHQKYRYFLINCLYSLKNDKYNAIKHLLKAIELDTHHKEIAKKDKDFKNLWDDEDFMKIT